MRILWLSNPPWVGSGYGEQTALFLPRFQQLGHEVAVVANFGLNGTRTDWNGIPVYPCDNQWGNTNVKIWADHFQADLVICLADAWVMKPDQWDGLNMAIWAPIDHYPIPPLVFQTLNDDRVRSIAMSTFGETLMQQAGLQPSYVPHGVDTTMFRPQPQHRDEIRDHLGIPRDVFLAGMVAANRCSTAVHRKAFPQVFHAFSMFAKNHDDAWLYAHTEPRPNAGGGFDLDVLATATGCPPGRVRFPPDKVWKLGVPKEAMALIYQAFDVLLSPSMGEGFGIPILEAQASGVPVLVSDHSAMRELAHAGWVVGGDPWWDELQKSFYIAPSIEQISDRLEDAYQARGDQQLRQDAVEFAQSYDADRVTEEFWVPTLENIYAPNEVGPLVISDNGLNRKARRRLAKTGSS